MERLLADAAEKTHGVVTRQDLLRFGVSARELDRRLERGTLIAVHRGVYRVGHAAPSLDARYLAAVRACGDRAVLSGRAAAFLWGLLRAPPGRPEVTGPTDRHVAGIVFHRCRQIEKRRRLVRRAIPVLTVAETLVDLAALLPAPALARAVHEAQIKHRLKPSQVEECLRPNSPGAANLRRALHGDEPVTLSQLERRFLTLLRREGLPLPDMNRPFGRRRLDCEWPEHQVVVELDSYRYHSSRHSWEEDRRRERVVRARGDEFRRFTWGDVVDHPAPMLAELRGLLAENE